MKTKETGAVDTKADPNADLFNQEAPADWVGTGNAFLYRPDAFVARTVDGCMLCFNEVDGKRVYTAPAIWGFPVDVRDNPTADPPFTSIFILLTKDTMAYADGSKEKLQRISKGETVVITMTAALERVAELAQLHDRSVEVFMRPIGQRRLPKQPSNKIWDWEVKENPIVHARARALAADTSNGSVGKELHA